jgi:UPF0716 protein FxsA
VLKRLLLLFILVPVVEVYLLVQLAERLSWSAAVLITVITGVVGGSLAKREGLKVWSRWRQAMAEFRIPDEGVIEGLLVLVGGVLLVTPGVLTDTVGLLLLVPPSRRLVASAIRARVRRQLDLQVRQPSGRQAQHAPRVIETTGQGVERPPAR